MSRKKFISFSLRSLPLLGLLSTFVACGPSGISLSGTATVDGTPIQKGKISLVPKANVNSPTAMAPIIDGEFTIPAASQLREGSFDLRVSITADRTPKAQLTFLQGGNKAAVGTAISQALKDAPPSEESFTSDLEVTGSEDGIQLEFKREPEPKKRR
ncbi:hypothetical protein [Rhodopirellula bahusiensis]|uniref:hypothetical protein n=1 Tax=Rhodopirellula bahusiensis TaxID=2014065 RepID=UPI0018EB3F9A|nr:hypothetical protein [Rhodopirellula bahusiensis]